MRLPALLLALSAVLTSLPALADSADPGAVPPTPLSYPVPYAAPYAPPPLLWQARSVRRMERRSTGLMATGIALWGAGAVASGVGAVMMGKASLSPCPVVFAESALHSAGVAPTGGERIGTARQALGLGGGCTDEKAATTGGIILTAGVVGSLLGIPLFVLGNMKVPASLEEALVPQVQVGAGSAGLRWSF